MINEVISLDQLSLIQIQGEDAKKFLQGQLTCHMDELVIDHLQLAAQCNREGRVISLFLIYPSTKGYGLLVPRDLALITVTALKKYALFYKVEILDITLSYALFATNTSVPSPQQAHNLLINRLLPTWQVNIIPAEDLLTVMQYWQDLNIPVQPAARWTQLLIEHVIPTIHADTSAQFLPHDLNLHELQAISFNKGCYTGQEIIARMHYKAKLKKTLMPASISAEVILNPGMPLYKQLNTPAGCVIEFYKKAQKQLALLLLDKNDVKNADLHVAESDEYFKISFIT